MFWAEEFLWNIQQAERPLEHYVEEFLSVVHLVSWSDAMINACFCIGLNDAKLFRSITPDDCRRPVAEFINFVLALCNSNYYVDVEDSNLPPYVNTRPLQLTTSQRPPRAASMSLLPPVLPRSPQLSPA
ncbi:hypothetical protein M9458_008647, partial [Cirrhinus mrigala]